MNGMRRWFSHLVIGGIGILFLSSGCASTHPSTGYLDNIKFLSSGRHFEDEYIASGVHFSLYRKVKVEAVSLAYLEDRDRFEREDLRKLSVRFREEIENAFSGTYEILDHTEEPDHHTLVMRPVLTYITAPKRLTNFISTVLVFIPVNGGSAAFEAKIQEGGTGTLLAEMAEKQTFGKDWQSLTYGSYTRFIHAHAAFKDWAGKFHDLIHDPVYS